jgi:hypothetical protein
MAVDLHDHPVLQAKAMQVHLDAGVAQRRMAIWNANVAMFETLIVPSTSFALYAGLAEDRLLVIPNGTAMAGMPPLPFPDRPVIGLAETDLAHRLRLASRFDPPAGERRWQLGIDQKLHRLATSTG